MELRALDQLLPADHSARVVWDFVQKLDLSEYYAGEGVWSWLHVEDAASATVAAAERGNPGIYLVADDEPLPVSRWLPAFSQWVKAPPPPQISIEDALKAGGDDAVFYGTRMRGASNAKVRRELNFQPRPLELIPDAVVAHAG